jgi:GTP pyrophosphokinase
MESLAFRLAEARKNSGLTQGQVAENLHITTQSVSSWECGNSIPDTEKLPEIAALYGVTTDWLLSGKLPAAEILEVTSNLSDRLFSEARMITYVGAYCNAKGLYQTKKALAFAREKHNGQYRKPGHSDERIPYIYHPLLLTCHALALGLDEDDLLSACLLHDVCEDCGVKPEELPVGNEAMEAVRLLTKPDDFQKTEKYERAYYDRISENRIATMVKLLDRCNNISSMATSFTDEHMAEYIKETQTYIHPLMEKARASYPEYSNQLFLIRYHMNSVLDALRHHMRSALWAM